MLVRATATQHDLHVARFIESAVYFGVPFKVRGLGRQSASTTAGLGWKIKHVQRELCYLSKNQILLVVSAAEAIFCASPYEIVSKFLDADHPILFSAAIEAAEWESSLPPQASPYQSLYAGGYIATVGALTDLLGSLRVHPMASDMQIFQSLYEENPERVALDKECRIFQTLRHSDSQMGWNSTAHRPVNQRTNTQPCLLQDNGKPMGLLTDYAQRLPPPLEMRAKVISPDT